MKIEIISVSALCEGEEMLITLRISDDSGNVEKRKILIFTKQYLELGIRRGDVIDEALFDKLDELSRACKAIRKGSDLLAYSSSSKARLAQRLRSEGIDRESAENAASYLEDMGLINEELDVERAVQSCLKKLWGKKRIYRELCAKGYKMELIERELATLDGESLIENCVSLIRKRYKLIPDDPDGKRKMVAALTRYGYSFSEIKQAIIMVNK